MTSREGGGGGVDERLDQGERRDARGRDGDPGDPGERGDPGDPGKRRDPGDREGEDGRGGGDDQAVLEARARALARPPDGRGEGEEVELLVVRLAKERYAFEAPSARQVLELSSLTRLPSAAAPAVGVTSWRGGLLLVLDVREMLDLPSGGLPDLHRIVVLDGREDRGEVGVLVDAVEEIRRTPRSSIAEPPAGVAPRRELLTGATPDALLVLNVSRLVEALAESPSTPDPRMQP